jgi:aquaporin Z
MDTRKYLAELVGTFLFLTIGYASVAAAGAAGVPPLLVVPFSFGLGLLAAIFAVGHISGGHFNPAVTVAAVLDKRTDTTDAIGYILAQVIGAIGAAAVVFVVAGQPAVAAGITRPGGDVSDIGALILVSTKRAAGLAPLVIPLSLVAIHFGAATLSGASVNPARSIGSALLGNDLTGLWIYLLGPIVGAVGGWALFRVLDEDPVEEVVIT